MSNSVDFVNNSLQYRFIDLNINVTLTLEDGDFLFIPGFQSTDSNSHLNVPRNFFAALFYYTIQYADLINSDYTKMKYAMDASGWYSVSYSNAVVDASNQINSASLYQNVKYDYIRYLLKQITGNNTTSGLFRNTDQLLSTVVSMDVQFNSQILAILATCGTVNSPKLSDTFYNNPGRVLIDSILANDNVIETDNEARRAALISRMTTNATTEYNLTNALYAIGTITGNNSSYCYYPVYNRSITGYATPVTFDEYPGYTFYTASSPTAYANYDTVLNTAYYIVVSGLYKFPIYLTNTAQHSIAISYTQYPNITFYTNVTPINSQGGEPSGYVNIDTIKDTPYYIRATKPSDTVAKVYFPMYIATGTDRITMNAFTEYSNIQFYTSGSTSSSTTYKLYNIFNTTKTTPLYLNATRTNTNAGQDYKIYLNKGYTNAQNKSASYNTVTFTDASYAGLTFYSELRNYDSSPCYLYATKTTTSLPAYYYPITDVSSSTYNVPITFTDTEYSATYYTISGTPSVNNPPDYPNYDGFYLYGTLIGTTTPQYHPVFLKSTGLYSNAIQLIEYPNKTYYTDYINYNTDTAYYVNGTILAVTKIYYPVYKTSTTAHSTQVIFTDASFSGMTFYTTTGTPLQSNATLTSGITSTYLSIDVPHYIKESSTGLYKYPIYTSNSGTHTTAITVNARTLYTISSTFSDSYDSYVYTIYNSNVTQAYYIIATKTGTTVQDTYFPIYVNYTGHYGRTPITFTNYPDLIFYTDYEEVNNHFYPFTFEYGDSLSVRITYKPKYNTYLGREIKDYSYQVYLDMGLEQISTNPYKLTGDENPSNTVVAKMTYYDGTIYTALGTSKVFHYLLLNANLPSLYDSPYNFYPTLNDISNVSFDVNQSVAITGRWFFSVFCRPRSNGEYDAIGFDRFDTENVAVLNTWTSYNINTLKWTNNSLTNLSWQNVLDLSIEATTTPYGDINANSQQQIMVLAISTNISTCAASIRNVSVVFKDGRTITLS